MVVDVAERPVERPATRAGWPPLPLELEPMAAMVELGSLMVCPVYYGVGVPRGDGHRVLLLPGFMGDDSYLSILSGWLARLGYRPAHIGGGSSIGSLHAMLQQAIRRTEALAEDGRRVTLIGHSLGGMLARLAATVRSDCVDRVITLGTPITGDRSAGHPLVRRLSEALLSGDMDAFMARRAVPVPEGVQVTSIYSPLDGVVNWRNCVDPDPRATNIVVKGSHIGLTWNADVYRHLAGRLLS